MEGNVLVKKFLPAYYWRRVNRNEIFRYAGIRIYSPIEIIEWLRLWRSSHRSMEDFTDSLIVTRNI